MSLLIKLAIYAALAAAALGALRWAEHELVIHSSEYEKVVAERDKAQGLVDAGRARAAQLALDYQAANDRAAKAEKERDDATKSRAASLQDRAGRVRSGAGIALPADVAGVLDATANPSVGAGNGSAAAAQGPPLPDTTAAPVYDERELAKWIADTRAAYDSANDDSLTCRERYDGARAAQGASP